MSRDDGNWAKPVKTLESMSDTVGVSVSPLNPLKSLLTTSESGGASDANLPADLLMLSERVEAMLSDGSLNPVKSLDVLSDRVDVKSSVSPMSEAAPLETMSARAKFTASALAPL